MMAEPRAARRQVRRDVDVLVVGGGVVGAATAVLLATQNSTRGLSVGLVEPRVFALPAANVDWDLRVFALSRASQRLLEACGVWPQVLRRAHAYQGMRVWDSVDSADGPRALTFTAGELGEPELGHLADVATLQALTKRVSNINVVYIDANAQRAFVDTVGGNADGEAAQLFASSAASQSAREGCWGPRWAPPATAA